MSYSREQAEIERQKTVLAALSNDLTLPFLQVKTSLESVSGDITDQQKDTMLVGVEAGLQLIEAYRLALSSGSNLDLEPVSIGAMLQDVAHQLYPYAKQYSTSLEVDVDGKLAPALANKGNLYAAMQVLGSSIIRGQSVAHTTNFKHQSLLLGAHRSANNHIAAGVFSNLGGLSNQTLRSARKMASRARQPIVDLPPGSAAGVLIADMLCSAMWQPLRSATHHKMSGLAFNIPATKQLNFL